MQGGGTQRFQQKCWPRWFLVAMRPANKAPRWGSPASFPHLLAWWIQVTLRCVSLQVAFWGAGGRAAHFWELPWDSAGQACWGTASGASRGSAPLSPGEQRVCRVLAPQ